MLPGIMSEGRRGFFSAWYGLVKTKTWNASLGIAFVKDVWWIPLLTSEL